MGCSSSEAAIAAGLCEGSALTWQELKANLPILLSKNKELRLC